MSSQEEGREMGGGGGKGCCVGGLERELQKSMRAVQTPVTGSDSCECACGG